MACIVCIDRYSSVLTCITVFWHALHVLIYVGMYVCIARNGLH